MNRQEESYGLQETIVQWPSTEHTSRPESTTHMLDSLPKPVNGWTLLAVPFS